MAACLPACATDDGGGQSGGGKLAFDTTDVKFRALAKNGGMLATEVGGRKVLLIRVDAATVVAFDRICTHDGCDLAPEISGVWDAAKSQLQCLCHGSKFGQDGAVANGPAKKPLKKHTVTFDGKAGTADIG